MMPGRDGTGSVGVGSMTGRGMGCCAATGFGMGRARGFRRMYYMTGLPGSETLSGRSKRFRSWPGGGSARYGRK